MRAPDAGALLRELRGIEAPSSEKRPAAHAPKGGKGRSYARLNEGLRDSRRLCYFILRHHRGFGKSEGERGRQRPGGETCMYEEDYLLQRRPQNRRSHLYTPKGWKTGDPPGPAIICLHGYSGMKEVYGMDVPRRTSGRRAISFAGRWLLACTGARSPRLRQERGRARPPAAPRAGAGHLRRHLLHGDGRGRGPRADRHIRHELRRGERHLGGGLRRAREGGGLLRGGARGRALDALR